MWYTRASDDALLSLRNVLHARKITRGGDRTHNLRLRKPTRFHCATRARKSGGVVSCSTHSSSSCCTHSDRTQVVTGLDLKSSGLCPRRFEPCRSRFLLR